MRASRSILPETSYSQDSLLTEDLQSSGKEQQSFQRGTAFPEMFAEALPKDAFLQGLHPRRIDLERNLKATFLTKASSPPEGVAELVTAVSRSAQHRSLGGPDTDACAKNPRVGRSELRVACNRLQAALGVLLLAGRCGAPCVSPHASAQCRREPPDSGTTGGISLGSALGM
jgi:hypothetical protein